MEIWAFDRLSNMNSHFWPPIIVSPNLECDLPGDPKKKFIIESLPTHKLIFLLYSFSLQTILFFNKHFFMQQKKCYAKKALKENFKTLKENSGII